MPITKFMSYTKRFHLKIQQITTNWWLYSGQMIIFHQARFLVKFSGIYLSKSYLLGQIGRYKAFHPAGSPPQPAASSGAVAPRAHLQRARASVVGECQSWLGNDSHEGLFPKNPIPFLE